MATPRADTYSIASGAAFRAGRGAPAPAAGLPSWRTGRAALTWMEVPAGNLLSDVDPSNDPAYNPNYPARAPWRRTASGNTNYSNNNAALIAYCGTCYDDATGRVLLPLGEGHSDGAANEPYVFTAAADVPMWSMMRPPSGSVPLIAGGLPAGSTPQGASFLLDDGKETTGVYADGRPRAIHSYRKHVYVPGKGPVLSVQGGTFSSAGDAKRTLLLNETSWEWTQVATLAYSSTSSGCGSCYDPVRRKLYIAMPGSSRMIRIDVDSWASDLLTPAAIVNSSNAAAIYASDLDRVIHIGSGSDPLRVVHPDTGAVSIPVVPALPVALVAAMGLDWVPGLGLVVHPMEASGAVYLLRPPANGADTGAWTAETLATVGTPPGGMSGLGWWSKFFYSAKLRGLFRFHAANAKPWFLPLE